MDVFSAILEKISLSSTFYFRADFSAPWGMKIPRGPYAQFHLVTEGKCIMAVHKEKISLYPGDIVVFPKGTAHWLADKTSSNRRDGKDVVAAIKNGNSVFDGNGLATSLVCGHFEFDRDLDHPFIHQMPEIIHITDREVNKLPWLKTIAELILKETKVEAAGSKVLQKKLGEILFIHVMRAYMQTQKSQLGFFAALQDKKIGKALNAIHTSPEKQWQVADLAQVAGMSRTGFSNHFKSLLGKTPLSYITLWRINEAKAQLKESKKTVGEIAEAVGYNSEAAFNRVFKKRVAITPHKYRKVVLSR